MLTVPAKGNIPGLSKHSSWKQGPGISRITCEEQSSSEHTTDQHQGRVQPSLPSLPWPLEVWVQSPDSSDCLLPLTHSSTPTAQRPSCDQPPLIPRSQQQSTPYHHRQQTAPTVHRDQVGMVLHLILIPMVTEVLASSQSKK